MTYKEIILKKFLEMPKSKFTRTKLRMLLHINNKDIDSFNKAVKYLIKDNLIRESKKKKLYLCSENIFIGKFVFKSKKGIRICINTKKIENDKMKEIYISEKNSGSALHNDIVAVEKIYHNGNTEGVVISILERNTEILIGTYMQKDDNSLFGFVIADDDRFNKDIYIRKNNTLNAKTYDKVMVKIIRYPDKFDMNPEGKIVSILDLNKDIDNNYLTLLSDYGIKSNYNYKTLHQVEKMPNQLYEDDFKDRIDLTNMCIFTIDGEDSKDLDDAISIEKIDNKYKLGVHIADVSHYVKEDSPLDKEALNRGTSIYLINKVISMLPKKLSNNLCSLNPYEKRLTLSVIMLINKNGTVEKQEIFESFIESKSKLSYKNVSDFLENNNILNVNENSKKDGMDKQIEKSLYLAKELRDILRQKRLNRGAINFQFKKSYIELDEEDKPILVQAYNRRIANEIIEEFMIVCNETVAKYFNTLDIPFIYRIHEKPQEEKINNLLEYLISLNYEIPKDLDSKSLQDIINQAKNKREENTINLLLIESMQQAKYSPIEIGHFGLGSEYYSHFTSPIRRYPDLQIHRIIKAYLHGSLTSIKIENLKKRVDYASKISSKREREAQKLEIEYDNIKKVEFMIDKVGKEYEGIVSGINKNYIKVTLPNTIEGTISLNKIGDGNYSVVRENCNLVSIDGNEIILGTKIKIKVEKAIPEQQILLFEFVKFV